MYVQILFQQIFFAYCVPLLFHFVPLDQLLSLSDIAKFVWKQIGYKLVKAMGVTVLLPYQIPEGKTGAQAIDYLTKRLLALGAVHTGQFLVDCETYISTPQHGPSKTVHVLHDSEYPASTFSILDNGAGKQIPLVADNLFDLLMLKMTSVYTSKKQTKIESKGARFEYGDFLIKLGSVTMMENFKGILIEIEYRPCVVLSYCWEMIRETLQGFLGMQIAKEYPAYFSQQIMNPMGQQQIHPKQNDVYEPIDTINQYLESFTNYRKQNIMPVAGGGSGGAASAQNAAANMQSGNQRMRL